MTICVMRVNHIVAVNHRMPIAQKIFNKCWFLFFLDFLFLTKSFCFYFYPLRSHRQNAKSDTKGPTSFQIFCETLPPPYSGRAQSSQREVFLPSLGAPLPQTPFPDGADLEATDERNCGPLGTSLKRKSYAQKAWLWDRVAFCPVSVATFFWVTVTGSSGFSDSRITSTFSASSRFVRWSYQRSMPHSSACQTCTSLAPSTLCKP